jgi:hypothetical protein
MNSSLLGNPRRAAAGVIVLTIVACVALVGALMFWNRAQGANASLDETRTQLEAARKQAADLQTQMNSAQGGTNHGRPLKRSVGSLLPVVRLPLAFGDARSSYELAYE